MNDEQETITAVEPEKQPAAPGKTPDEVVQAHKRRTALVLYLAILFGVALLLVTFSMITQNQKLMDSSTSAIDRAEALQNENRELLRKQISLTEQAEALQNELNAANAQIEAEQEAAEAARAELAGEQEKTKALNDQITGLEQQLGAAKDACDLLLQAKAALDAGDEEAFVAAMTALESEQTHFGPEAAALYEALTAELPGETE